MSIDSDTLFDDEVKPSLTCIFCGHEEHAEIHEIWSPREFMLDTCCEGLRESISEFLASEPKQGADWLREKGLDAYVGHRSRRIVDDGACGLVVDWNLVIEDVSFATAKAFVSEHHRHCKAPRGWRFGAGIKNGNELIGVVMVGRPVARMLDASRVVEVNRLCIRTDIVPELSWNACSQLYGWAAREAKRRKFAKIITYTRLDETGATLKAAGWVVEHRTKGRHWDSPGRPREKSRDAIGKLRWTPSSMLNINPGISRTQKADSPSSICSMSAA